VFIDWNAFGADAVILSIRVSLGFVVLARVRCVAGDGNAKPLSRSDHDIGRLLVISLYGLATLDMLFLELTRLAKDGISNCGSQISSL